MPPTVHYSLHPLYTTNPCRSSAEYDTSTKMPGPTRRGQGMGWVPVPGELPVDTSSIKEAIHAFKMLDLRTPCRVHSTPMWFGCTPLVLYAPCRVHSTPACHRCTLHVLLCTPPLHTRRSSTAYCMVFVDVLCIVLFIAHAPCRPEHDFLVNKVGRSLSTF